MELKDTIEMMNSSDYKERFKAEYWQTMIRCKKLETFMYKWGNGMLDFTPSCPRSILNRQLNYMYDYADILAVRAKIEGIDLEVK